MNQSDNDYLITLEPSGWRFPAHARRTLLQSAEAAGIDLPSSCRNGSCRTCLCQLASGKVVYLIAWPGLSADEKCDGFILPCVALPVSDLTLVHPAARRPPGADAHLTPTPIPAHD